LAGVRQGQGSDPSDRRAGQSHPHGELLIEEQRCPPANWPWNGIAEVTVRCRLQEFAGPIPKRLAPQNQPVAKIVPRGRDHLAKRLIDLPSVFLDQLPGAAVRFHQMRLSVFPCPKSSQTGPACQETVPVTGLASSGSTSSGSRQAHQIRKNGTRSNVFGPIPSTFRKP
jgi:hypothetical protein